MLRLLAAHAPLDLGLLIAADVGRCVSIAGVVGGGRGCACGRPRGRGRVAAPSIVVIRLLGSSIGRHGRLCPVLLLLLLRCRGDPVVGTGGLLGGRVLSVLCGLVLQ